MVSGGMMSVNDFAPAAFFLDELVYFASLEAVPPAWAVALVVLL